MSTLLPTSPQAVEAWLRSLANPSDLLKMREAGQSEYPYLFGIATVKLADAHREYLRLLGRQAESREEIDECRADDANNRRIFKRVLDAIGIHGAFKEDELIERVSRMVRR